MFKRLSGKLTRTCVSTVLAAALLFSAVPIGLIDSPFLHTVRSVQASSDDEPCTLEQELTGIDGKKYHFTATYSQDAGIPSDAELVVNEISEGEEYDGYLEEVQATLEEKTVEKVHLFDISIMKDDTEYQPKDGYPVNMKIELEETSSEDLTVVHFAEEPGEGEAEIIENITLPGEDDTTIVEFAAESFSVYAIVEHEGEDVVTPRFTVHYLSPVTDLASQESVVNGEYYYTVSSYSFPNTANQMQTTQIVQDGETLEMIVNPPNMANKFFFGWYVVDETSSNGNNYTYRWTQSPDHLPFETPISVTDNGDGTFTMSWTVDGKTCSKTAEMDPTDYSAHIYVAPIYENYCFVNFHELAYAVSNASNLLTRKLVILGSDGTESVLISDVSAKATDTIRRIFRGWQYRTNNTWISVQTMDDNGNPITKSIDVTEDVDLYPYFQEGRWLYFNVGDSGNGATYVPAQFTLAEFDSEDGGASVGGEVTSLPPTSRVGYDFGGWRVITGYTNGDPDQPEYMLVTDENGNFLPSVDLSIDGTYEDNDGNLQTGVAYTIKNGKLTIKYPLESLTFYAEWIEKANSSYTVVIWKQKVTDDPNASNADKEYDYYELDPSVLPSVVASASGLTVDQLNLNSYRSLTSNSSTSADFKGFHLRTTDPVVMSDERVRGDGSTVVNIYYDRNVHTLSFQIRQGNRWNTIKEITALYQQNISSYFPIVGTNGVTYNSGERWDPQNSSTYSQVLVYIDVMPDESINFHLDTSTQPQKNLYYYIEPLPGTPASSTDRTYNGKRFVLYHHTVANYGFFTEAEDYLPLVGFVKSNAYPPQAFNSSGGSVNQVWGSGSSAVEIYCYYLRDGRSLTFDYNYPIATGMASKTVVKNGVLYETPLEMYDYRAHPDDTENAIRPTGSDIPAHYEFGGWFEDKACTKPFDFSTTMPAADKIVYGKWTPIYYYIEVDPNGGEINHINFTEATDGGWPTFYLGGFDSSNSSDPKWIAAWNANGDVIGSTPSWVSVLQNIGTGHNTSQSTYFSAMYGTAIGEYELERTFVEYEGADDGTKYYYMNMQFDDTSGDWGLHADLRNALYLTADELEAYYKYLKAAQAWHEASRPGYYDGTIPATFEDFKDRYVKKDNNGDFVLYEEVPSGSYAFVGWYVVKPDGTLSDTPYNFANEVEDTIKLRAVWRKVGSYYIAYNPSYILTLGDGTQVFINGEITAWTDPVNSGEEMYNDGAQTTTLQQPTGVTVNGQEMGDDYIFRGWQVVKYTGYDANGYATFTPLHDVYYAEPTPFVIDAHDADANGCIHMQAIYQLSTEADRRPLVANLMLNANDGYLVDGNGSELNSVQNITAASGWTDSGSVVEDGSANEIVFGDMQSNAAVHIYKYGVTPGMLDAPYDVSTNYYKHPNNYLLIGFDEGSDYTLSKTSATEDDLKTGAAYVPTYATDSVISVQRTDSVRLYAVWEPMVYVTFTNRTDSPVTYTISGTGAAMSIVNQATGAFGREKFTETTITLDPGESIKLVMPEGAGEQFTINGINRSTTQLLNVSSYFRGQQTGLATAGLYRSSEADFTLSDTLHEDPVGVQVYFDGVDTIFYDTNGGTWTDTARTGSSYDSVINDSSLVYVDEDGLPYEPVDLSNGNTAKATEPSDPTRTGYTFIGWTTSEEAALCEPDGYTLPGTSAADGINNLAVIKRDLLWDFDRDVHSGMTLYAVWGQNVTVTFHLTNNHTWNSGNDSDYFVPGNNRTYVVTLAKGDTVAMPISPSWNNNTNQFYRWVTVNSHQNAAKTINNITDIYDFSAPVNANLDLYTSWIAAEHFDVVVEKTVANTDGSGLTSGQQNKEFTFKAVITTMTYTGSVRRTSSGWINPTYTFTTSVNDGVKTSEEEQTFTLKNGESFTVPLYFENDNTVQISSNTTVSTTIFFQQVTITEVSDPEYTVSFSVNGQPISVGDTVTVYSKDPSVTPALSTTGTGSSRTYTLSCNTSYPKDSQVPVDFTNTRTHTSVDVTKSVVADDYTTGDEEFTFAVEYRDTNGTVVTPTEYIGTTFTLKNGETRKLEHVPIGGTVVVTETADGWTAVSSNDADPTQTSGKTFTLASISEEGGSITFTNARDTYDVTVTNQVLPVEYGSKTKSFTYTATLWNGDKQVVFPSSISNATFSNGRKEMTFVLKDGESYVIKDLPGGYKLIVTQIAEEDYVTKVGKDSETKVEALTYTISNLASDAQIGFVNTLKIGDYTITKNVQLTGSQTIPAGTTFAFTAKLLSTANSGTPVAISSDIEAMVSALGGSVSGDVINFTLANGGSITLTGLPVGYFLQVQENAPGYAAYVNGIRTYAVTVPIAETGNSDINYINRIAEATLKIQKVDKETGDPIPGTAFRLYNIKNGSQNTMFTLVSGTDGFLAYTESGETKQELSLESGTYYLAEQAHAGGYEPLPNEIVITVDNTKSSDERISISQSSDTTLTYDTVEGKFTLTVANAKVKTPAPTGLSFDFRPFVMALFTGLILFVSVKRGKEKKEEEDTPDEA